MSSLHRFSLLPVALLLVAGTASARQTDTGYASWYNRGFHGLQTASGETYDHEALTGAHRTLPFGTLLRVTRLDTGASVVVRINDRMPSGPGHLVDLSGAAARQLELLRVGVSQVRIEVVTPSVAQAAQRPLDGPAGRPDSPVTPVALPRAVPTTTAANLPTGSFTLQIGAFNRRDSAESLAVQFPDAYIVAYETAGAPFFRVYLGSYRDEPAARAEQAQLWDRGHDSFLRRL